MNVKVHYAGQVLILTEGTTRSSVQVEVMRNAASGGGLVELALANGRTVSIAVGPNIPIAIEGD